MKSKILKYLLLAVFTAAAALFGLGISMPRIFYPAHSFREFRLIHPDGWVEDGASLEFQGLYERGNYLALHFQKWRPGTNESAHLLIRVCGGEPIEVVVSEDGPISIPLQGSCEPRRVDISVQNPVSAPGADDRKLGAKLISAEIVSKMGMPVVEPRLLVYAFLSIFSLGIVALALSLPLAALFVPLAAFALLSRTENLNLEGPFYLWTLLMPLLCGILFAKAVGRYALKNEIDSPHSHYGRRTEPVVILMLSFALIGGAALRFYGIDFGLPFHFHPDEVPKVNVILRMDQEGTLNPRYFLHPSLLLYLSYGVGKLLAAFGFGALEQTAYLGGRLVSASAGTISIYLVYILGKRLVGAGAGVLAAFSLALFPLHVTCSRYLKEDSLFVFMVLVALCTMVKAAQEKKPLLLLVSGILAGAAAGTKYTGLLLIAPLLFSPWLRSRKLEPDPEFFGFATLAVLLMPFGFAATTPYSILDFQHFILGFGKEGKHMLHGHTTGIDPWSQFWMYHFGHSVVPGLTWPMLVLAMGGLGVMLYRRKVEDLFVLGVVLLFYLPSEWVKAKPAPQAERYILPCLPFLALAMSEGMRVLWQSKYRIVFPFLVAGSLCVAGYRTISLARDLSPDTREVAASWIAQHIPPGQKILIDFEPYGPPLLGKGYEVTFLKPSDYRMRLNSFGARRSGFDYLVLSSLFYERFLSQPGASFEMRRGIESILAELPKEYETESLSGTYGFHNPKITIVRLTPP